MSLSGKKILLGVTGSIAAYKAALLIRLLKKEGAEVQVVMTASALGFIAPLTLSTLSGRPVLTEFVRDGTGVWNSHVELGLWADLLLFAPASAHTLAKMANGLCDNLLMAVYLSARCPVAFAPAMDLDMYVHPATEENIRKLVARGHYLIDAEAGELASGLVGKGRMAEPEHILEKVMDFLLPPKPLLGKNILITAGPTCEYLDPVRFITNASSGKMGYALADACAKLGAHVTIVSGPVAVRAEEPAVRVVSVISAADMFEAVSERHGEADVAIFAAAVADYTPAQKSAIKIKKNDAEMVMVLSKTKDIAKEMGVRKKEGQIHIGFALETNDEEDNARNKLISKRFDFVVLNSLRDAGAGFGHDTNRIYLLDEKGKREFPLKHKKEVASDIVQFLLEKIGLQSK
jgi:phosphopantothenoylcysteine decarboxylase / phosphopantothenate---cysteine ligase